MPCAELRQIGAGEGGIEGRKPSPLPHDLTHLDVNAADHGRLERLHNDSRCGRNQLATTDHDAIHFGE